MFVSRAAIDWDEAQHPRGQPGNPGQFSEGGGGDEGGGAGKAPSAADAQAAAEAAAQAEIDAIGATASADVAAAQAGGPGNKKSSKNDFEKQGVKISKSRGGSEEQALSNWNENVGMAPAEFKQSFLGGLDATVNVIQPQEGMLNITGRILDEKGEVIGQYDRNIDFKNKTAYSEALQLDQPQQGKGIGKQVLAANVATYQNLGLDKVVTYADSSVGGYAWAKYGYVPTADAWESLRDKVSDRLDELEDLIPEDHFFFMRDLTKQSDPKAAWVIADSEYGKRLLLGLEWEGELNLKDPETMTRFRSYIGR